MKGDTVTVGDVLIHLKVAAKHNKSVLSATLQKALEKEYGSKVSKEDVDKLISKLQNNTEMTIPEIAERLELSRTSATQIVNELCKEKVLKKVGTRDATTAGGKPPRVFFHECIIPLHDYCNYRKRFYQL